MQNTQKLIIISTSISFFVALAIRGYGFYTNDQNAFLQIADAFAQSVHPVKSLEAAHCGFVNFHPPFLVLILAVLIKISSWYAAPMILQITSALITLVMLFKIQDLCIPKASFHQRFSLLLLFFLIPLTHQNTLFIDIDNTLIVIWMTVFIHAINKFSPSLKNHLLMGILFGAGLFCKLTTPLAVLFLWCAIECIKRPTLQDLGKIFVTIATSTTVFLSIYLLSCQIWYLPVYDPFIVTFGKFLGNSYQVFHWVRFVGTSLRSIYYDINWFTPLIFVLLAISTIKEIRQCITIRKFGTALYLHLFFWYLYFGYTFLIPTSYLPRYKSGLMPLMIIMLWNHFDIFLHSLNLRMKLLLVISSVICLLVIPDIPTSSIYFKFKYHWFALYQLNFDYYPQWFKQFLLYWSEITERHWLLIPLRILFFATHYFSFAIFPIIAFYSIPGLIAFRMLKSWLNALFFVALPVWCAMFVQDMSHEYQLYYDAGYSGFEETVTFLKQNLKADEPFLGYRDLGFYTGHQAFTLYRWSGHRILDTMHIDSIADARSIRYISYLNDDFYNNEQFTSYLNDNCTIAFSNKDYRVYKYVKNSQE